MSECQELQAKVATLTEKLRELRAAHSGACRQRNDAERLASRLREENAAQAAIIASAHLVDETAEPEPEEAFPNVDPELVALRLLITRLRTENHEAYAAGICWALNGVKTITAGLAEATGQPRRIGRRAA